MPRMITVDKNPDYPIPFRELIKEKLLWIYFKATAIYIFIFDKIKGNIELPIKDELMKNIGVRKSIRLRNVFLYKKLSFSTFV
jgi:hypothetical protein